MEDKHEYKGWLNSDSFLKRAFAIWGYYFVANFIISAAVFIVMTFIFLLIGVSLFSALDMSGFN